MTANTIGYIKMDGTGPVAGVRPSAPPDVPPAQFIADNRIHVKDGAVFVDGYLSVHPRELAPENEAKLRQKLAVTYSLSSPSFYEDDKRMAIALGLGSFVAVPLSAKHAKLAKDIEKFNREAKTGQDEGLTNALRDHHAPMDAILADLGKDPNADPVGLEELKNGLSVYLLCREKLSRSGFLATLPDYVHHHENGDQVAQELSAKTGLTPLQLREAAYRGGIDGVGQALGLEPAFVQEVKGLVDQLATREFSLHDIEHWHQGRMLAPQASLPEKMQLGAAAHIDKSIKDLRAKVHHVYDVPDAIKQQEQAIAHGLSLIEPIERAVLHKLGYEICYTPENTADHIAFHKGIYGLHRKTADDMRDVRGTYRIYFSGKGNEKDSMRTLRHEIAHNLWPAEMTPQEISTIDQMAELDRTRFDALRTLTTAHKDTLETLVARYHMAGNPQQQQQAVAMAEQVFPGLGKVLPHLQGVDQLSWMVAEAQDRLSVEGPLYNRTGYHDAATRYREVISRYSELRYVAYSEQPEMQHLLNFVAPGTTAIFDRIYLPHLERLYQKISQAPQAASTAPHALMDEGEGKKPFIPPQPQTAPTGKVDERPAGQPAFAPASAAHPANCTAACCAPQQQASVAAHAEGCGCNACTPAQLPSNAGVHAASLQARYPAASRVLQALGIETSSTDHSFARS